MQTISRIARIYGHRRILSTLVRRDLKVRYGRSVLGYVWTLIDPLAMAGVYYLVFGLVFQRAEVESLPFMVFLLSGLLPWQWFNLSITETARALYSERLLVRSTNMPREIWVIRVVLAKGVEFLLSLPILVGFVVYYMATGEVTLNWRLVLILPALVIQFVLLIGMGLVLAPVTVLVDDIVRVVRIVLRVLFYLTPVLYSPAALDAYEWAIGSSVQPAHRDHRAVPGRARRRRPSTGAAIGISAGSRARVVGRRWLGLQRASSAQSSRRSDGRSRHRRRAGSASSSTARRRKMSLRDMLFRARPRL